MPENKTLPGAAAADRVIALDGHARLSVAKDLRVQVGKHLRIEAQDSLELVVGQASLLMKKDGSIVIKGRTLRFEASEAVEVKASSGVLIKGGKLAQN